MAGGGSRPGAGRKVLPLNVKKAKGTLDNSREKKRQQGAKPSDDKPVSPDMLNEAQRRYFELIVSRIEEIGQASKTHTEIITLLAIRLEEIERFGTELRDHGASFITSNAFGDKIVKPRPEYQIYKDAMRHAHTLLSEVGLTPGAAMKIPTKPKEEQNEFGEF